jgi:antitoxin CcdA
MPRKSTSLSLDADLIARAKNAGVNLSRAAEAGIEQDVRRAEAELWKDENKAAFEAYDKFVEENGILLSKHRMF